MVCQAFGVQRSSYYEHKKSRQRINPKRRSLKADVKGVFKVSRCALGSRAICNVLSTEGINIGRYLVRRLTDESGLVSK